MPMIRVEMLPGRTVEQKRAFARSVTDSAAELLGCSPAAVAVVFAEVDRQDWANGGVLESDKAEGKS